MKLSTDLIEERFGKYISGLCRSLAEGTTCEEDMRQEVVLALLEHDFEAKASTSIWDGKPIPVDPSHVIRQARCRAIDFWRSEKARLRKMRPMQDAGQPEARKVHDTLAEQEILQVLSEKLSDSDYLIVITKVAPPEEVIRLAVADFEKANAERRAGRLRMNVESVNIFDKHVGKHLGVSNATVSRAVKKAKQVLLDEGLLPGSERASLAAPRSTTA